MEQLDAKLRPRFQHNSQPPAMFIYPSLVVFVCSDGMENDSSPKAAKSTALLSDGAVLPVIADVS